MELRLNAFALGSRGEDLGAAFEANWNEGGRSGAMSYGHRVADRAESLGILGELKAGLPNGPLLVPVRNLNAGHRKNGERQEHSKTTSNCGHTLHAFT